MESADLIVVTFNGRSSLAFSRAEPCIALPDGITMKTIINEITLKLSTKIQSIKLTNGLLANVGNFRKFHRETFLFYN
jgi:hypothetical protein